MTLMSTLAEDFLSPQSTALLSDSPLPSNDGEDEADYATVQQEATRKGETTACLTCLHCRSCLLGLLIGGIALAALALNAPCSLSFLAPVSARHAAVNDSFANGSFVHDSFVNDSFVHDTQPSTAAGSAAAVSVSDCLPCECPCSSGPYIFQRDCPLYGEGIGSKLQWLKLSLTVAAMTGFTFLADRGCFTESHNHQDLSDRLWLHRAPDCDPCSLRAADMRLVPGPWPSDYWSEPIFHQAVCPAISPRHAVNLSRSRRWAIDRSEVVGREALSSIIIQLVAMRDVHHSRAVFVFEKQNRPLEFLNSCSAPVVRQRYELAYSQQQKAHNRPQPAMVQRLLHVAVHFRWGDTAVNSTEEPGNRAGFPLHTFSNVVQSIASLPALRNRTRVWFLSEGNTADFGSFTPVPLASSDDGPGLVLRLGEQSSDARSDILTDLDVMAHADVLIGGESSFFALASQLRRPEERVLIGRIHDSNRERNPKFADHGTGFYRQMLDVQPFDEEEFRRQLEALPQYRAKLALP